MKARRREFKRIVLLFGPSTLCSAMDFNCFVEARDHLLDEPAPVRKRGRPRKSKKGLTPKSINNLLKIALRILNFASDKMGLSLPNKPVPPFYDLLLAETPRSRYLREGPEQERLLERCGQDLADIIEFDIETGLRWNELSALRWDEIDTLEESIRVYIKGRGHDPIPHTVFLSERALQILDRRRNGAQSEFVFTTATDSTYQQGDCQIQKGSQVPFTYNRMHRAFSKALSDAGITDFGFHDLRRTAARRLWWDANLEIAAAFLGHKDTKTTLKYLGLSKEDDKAAQLHRAKQQARRRAEVEKAISEGLPPPEFEDKRIQRIRAQFLLEKDLVARRKAT